MAKKLFLMLCFSFLACQPVVAQFYPTRYRPPDLNWQQLSTPHFNILFPAGEDSAAWKTARILEKEYPKVRQLTGGYLSHFPVILNNYNDRSNGLVTSLHFRSEIDISPNKSKTLNPKTGGWLENVVPHELTHAVQFSHLGGVGLGQLVHIFSPDLARSMHGASPSGIQEGLAVYYESNGVVPGGGRGNYPFFTHQFDAVFDSPARWSMGQMVHFPAYSRPFNRHYIGGFKFTQWLQDTYGPKTSRDAIDFHIRWPFLGYGVALKHATGRWPAQLYNEFENDNSQQLPLKSPKYTPLPINPEGAEIRRPKWLADSTLIFYGSFYNAAPGFYTYGLTHHSLRRKVTTGTVSDYNYALSTHRDTLWYSYNKPDLIYPNAYKTTLAKVKLTNGLIRNKINTQRLYDPVILSDSAIIALKGHNATADVVEIDEKTNRLVTVLFSDSVSTPVSVDANPAGDSLAVIMNHHGEQALWLAPVKNLRNDLKKSPSLSFSNGSVFDACWHPQGGRVLFSSDYSGTLQVYEYTLSSGRITQITDAPYNAFEASYAPGGDRIAFVIQKRNERLPVVLSRDQFYGKPVDPSAFSRNKQTKPPGLRVSIAADTSWTRRDYSTGFSWLKPRTVLPAVDEISGSDQYQLGAGFHSSDLLQEQAYSLQLTTAKERLWYDLTYRNQQFFPGFKAHIFSEPSFHRFQFKSPSNQSFTQTFLRQERSFALSVPMQFTFRQNVDFSGLYLEPEVRQSQLRYFDQDGQHASDFSNATIGNLFGQLNYRLRQNIRDVQPGRGLVLYSELEHYFYSESLTLPTVSGEASLDFAQPTALRAGIFGYLSPLRRWNQSLRLGLEAITQTAPVFDNQSVVSNGFGDPVYRFSNNLASLNSRYTIPLFYPDNGGLLVPLYVSSIYISAFSDTVFDPSGGNLFSSSQTVIGGGLRVQFRISNLSFDVGAGIGWEPSRQKIHYFIGDF